MYTAFEIASYICNRYQEENNVRIDEMKLHKLMYFAQRESLIQNGTPLFEDEFEAWKYGPVLPEIRGYYKADKFDKSYYNSDLIPVMNKVFSEYSHIMSWTLSMISHGEESWKKARQGTADGEPCCNKIKIEDIKIDAKRVRDSRGSIIC